MFAPKPPNCIPPLHLIRLDVVRRNLGLRPKSKAHLKSKARNDAVRTMAAGKVPAARTTTGTVAAARVAKVAAAKMATLNVNKTAARLTKPPALPPPRPRSCCKRVATLRGSVALAVANATPPMRNSRLLVPKAQAVQMIANKRQQIANKRQQLQMAPPVSKAMWTARGTQHPTMPKATLTAAVADGSRGSIVQKPQPATLTATN